MPEPVSLRVLEIIRQWFAEDAGIMTTGLDLRDYTNDLKAADKPALFVLRGAPDTGLVRETEGGIVEPLTVDLVGFVEAPVLDESESPDVPITPPRVTETRERFLQVVIRRLYGTNEYGETLAARLQEDRATYGNGVEDFVHVGPPLTDQGYEPPHGIFELPCRALLHYQDTEF